METRVQKWGNSLALRIPQAFAAEAGLKRDSLVELSLEDGRLVIAPIAARPYTLDELLAGVTADNLHAEVDTGGPSGSEAW